jgi:threonine/homoserine/homoserine lactone efflux protein
MTIQLFLSFIATSLIFGLVPGPSVCFTIGHGLQHGGLRTLATIAGQAAANGLQLLVIVCGLSRVLAQSAAALSAMKAVGAVYLVYLGIRTFFAAAPQVARGDEGRAGGLARSVLDGFIVCATNPKALLYYAALLPQFIAPDGDRSGQLVLLGVSSVLIGVLVLSFYALLAGHARRRLLRSRWWRAQRRVTGALMVSAGAALGLSDVGGAAGR